MFNVVYQKASASQLSEVKKLLQRSNLPFEDIDAHFDNYFVAMIENEIVGVLGTEAYGRLALLRSMAVDVKYRNNEIANSLLQQILQISKENKIQTLFLLTTTAQNYFLKHGFEIVERNQLPDVIQNTKEFQDICPVSAVCMKRDL